MEETSFVERLTRIETKIDVFLVAHDDHETRLRRLERAVYIATGAAAMFGGAVGTVLVKVFEQV
jgi:hypothetical protein